MQICTSSPLLCASPEAHSGGLVRAAEHHSQFCSRLFVKTAWLLYVELCQSSPHIAGCSALAKLCARGSMFCMLFVEVIRALPMKCIVLSHMLMLCAVLKCFPVLCMLCSKHVWLVRFSRTAQTICTGGMCRDFPTRHPERARKLRPRAKFSQMAKLMRTPVQVCATFVQM